MNRLKVFFSIIAAKLTHIVGNILGKGTSKPGQIALRIFPDVLNYIKLPKTVIAVTGSNGKSSTVNMIYHLLKSNGLSIACNNKGSNQLEGVTTTVLTQATLGGKLKHDVLLIECDERYTRFIFKYIKPDYYVVTNIYRDQLTRNGHPEEIFGILNDYLPKDSHMILNCDDVLVSLLSKKAAKTSWYGVSAPGVSTRVGSVYNDAVLCPDCKAKLCWDNNYYTCDNCGFHRHEPDCAITSLSLKDKKITINNQHDIPLMTGSLFYSYNTLAAFTVAKLLGFDDQNTAQLLSHYETENGRKTEFSVNNREGTLLIAKHENSTAYNQCFQLATLCEGGCDVMIIVDQISRKYFTSDTSWLWDIDFNLLCDKNIHHLILAGKYVNDLMVRLSYTDFPMDRITHFEDINQAIENMDSDRKKPLYVITCFSDQMKFMNNPCVKKVKK